MCTSKIELSNIDFRLGDYILSLNHLGHAEPRKPWHITPHTHTLYEVHCISVGSGILYTPTDRYEMTPGTVCMTGPGIYHAQTSEIDDSMDEYCLRFTIEHSPIQGADQSENAIVQAIIDHPFFITKDDIDCLSQIKIMLDESYCRLPGFKMKLCCHFGEFLINIGRHCRGEKLSNKDIPPLVEIGEIDLKSKIDTYFFFYDNPIPIEDIICDLHITRRHFSRLMQKYYGMSYMEKITELRVNYAKQLLISTNESVSKIAQQIGFGTQQQFIRKFKISFGMTPGEFRNKNKNKK